MKWLSVFVLIAAGFARPVSAQLKEIELTSKYKDDNSLVITAEKRVPGTYFVGLQFTEVSNANLNSRFYRAITGTGELLTIRSMNSDDYPRVRYTYHWMQGNPDCKPDSTFVYRLPYSTSVSRQVDSLRLLKNSKLKSVNWYSLQFQMEKGDTVYAARTGLVIEVKTDAEDPEAPETGRYTYKADVNSVKVEHADGTIAEYSVLEAPMVKPGDRVFPDTPLGLAGTYDNERYQTRLRIHYIRLMKNAPDHTPFMFEYHYIRPAFASTQGEMKLTLRQKYQPVVTGEMIVREMNRREARKYQSQ